MNATTNKETTDRQKAKTRSTMLRSFRGLTRNYFARETRWQLAIEILLFAIIAALSAWPILAAASALNEFLNRTVS
jgi:hypothetical protein